MQIAVAKGSEGSWPAHHLVQLQAHQARHSRCTGSDGWDNLAHDSLALSRTGDLVWAQDVGLDLTQTSRLEPQQGYLGTVSWWDPIILSSQACCCRHKVHMEVAVIIL